MSLLALHNRANVDPSAAGPWFKSLFDSVLVSRNHTLQNSNSLMDCYTEAYRYFVTGYGKETDQLEVAIEKAIVCHKQQIAMAVDDILPYSAQSFAKTYTTAWINFCADLNILAIVCKYAMLKVQAWRDLFDPENVVARWNDAILSDPAICTALRSVFHGVPQLQHQALHALQLAATEANPAIQDSYVDLQGTFVEENAKSNIAGCAACLRECGIANVVQVSGDGTARALYPLPSSIRRA